MDFFNEATLRLKQQLKTTQDKVVAEFLGFKPSAWVRRKNRDAFPEKELYVLAAKKPELNIDVQYVLTGEHASERQSLIVQNMIEASGDDERLQSLTVETVKNIGRRQKIYKNLEELLDSCSDESLEHIIWFVKKIRLADVQIDKQD